MRMAILGFHIHQSYNLTLTFITFFVFQITHMIEKCAMSAFQFTTVLCSLLLFCWFLFFLFAALRIKPKASHMLVKYCATEQPLSIFLVLFHVYPVEVLIFIVF